MNSYESVTKYCDFFLDVNCFELRLRKKPLFIMFCVQFRVEYNKTPKNYNSSNFHNSNNIRNLLQV